MLREMAFDGEGTYLVSGAAVVAFHEYSGFEAGGL
jgi:hypothetical protein